MAQVNTKMISQNSLQSHFQETTGSSRTLRLNYKTINLIFFKVCEWE